MSVTSAMSLRDRFCVNRKGGMGGASEGYVQNVWSTR